MRTAAVLTSAISAAAFVVLAVLVRVRPRIAALVLMTISLLGIGFVGWFFLSATPYNNPLAFFCVGSLVIILFGCTGLALWRGSRVV